MNTKRATLAALVVTVILAIVGTPHQFWASPSFSMKSVYWITIVANWGILYLVIYGLRNQKMRSYVGIYKYIAVAAVEIMAMLILLMAIEIFNMAVDGSSALYVSSMQNINPIKWGKALPYFPTILIGLYLAYKGLMSDWEGNEVSSESDED